VRQRRKRGAETQAIGVTKGGRNSKVHAMVDEECRPWAFILTPGNTADCVVAQTCVSLIPGITELVADKGYDTDAFRSFLKERGIKPSSRANPIARSASATTRKLTKDAMSSSAAFAASRIGGASPHVTTSSRKTFSQPYVSLPCWRTGFDLIESRP
jgi:IS5 family transposase